MLTKPLLQLRQHCGCSWWRHQMETFSALLAIWFLNLKLSSSCVCPLHNNFKRAGIIFASIKSVYTPLCLRIHPAHLALLYDYTFVLLCSPDSADYITMGDAPQNGITGNHCDVADVPTYSWPGAESDAEAARVAALGYKPGISSTCVRQHYDDLSLDYDDVNWSYICDDLNSIALVSNHRHPQCMWMFPGPLFH